MVLRLYCLHTADSPPNSCARDFLFCVPFCRQKQRADERALPIEGLPSHLQQGSTPPESPAPPKFTAPSEATLRRLPLGRRNGRVPEAVDAQPLRADRKPGDLGHRVCLALYRFSSPLILLPHGDDHERQQTRHTRHYDSVEEASDVIVLLALFGGHQA